MDMENQTISQLADDPISLVQVILQEDLVRRERKSKPDVIVEMIILYVALVILSRNASCACAVLYPHRCLHLLLTKVNTIDIPVHTGLHITRNSRMVGICLQMRMSQSFGPLNQKRVKWRIFRRLKTTGF